MSYIKEDISGKKTVVAIGKFDGVHKGHKKLLKTAAEIAFGAGFVSVGFVVSNDRGPMLLTPQKREQEIKSLGIDRVEVQNLTPDFMNMSAEQFVKEILCNRLNCAHVVVGYNFRFARGRAADARDLKVICQNNGIDCTVISEVVCSTASGNITASSTNVRDFLFRGDVKSASDLLGRPYCISGKVVSGKKLGRTIDFPTANIDVNCRYSMPKNGVYATGTYINDKKYLSVTNIGDNPTVNENGNITVETNIIDFSDDIYGEEIRVEFVDRIRDEKKFKSVKELKNQIQKDIEFTLLTK